MYPDLFGIDNFSYTLCMFIGLISAFLIAFFYLKKKNLTKDGLIDLTICFCFAVTAGLIFSVLFQNLYYLIKYGKQAKWCWEMTFYGGLIGGVGGFVLTYWLMRKDVNFDILDVLKVAPVSITAAHGIGRIGCFLAGCCYGKETTSWIGINFPNDGLARVIPTQLIEAIFLLLLCGVLTFLLCKKDYKYNALIYLGAYSIFRFIIEFFRGDDRGKSFIFSPSQVISLLLLLACIPLFFLFKKVFKDEEK